MTGIMTDEKMQAAREADAVQAAALDAPLDQNAQLQPVDAELAQEELTLPDRIEQNKMIPNVPAQVTVAGRSAVAKQFVGVGTMNVKTPRGEVKANSGDFIFDFGPSSITGGVYVISNDLTQALAAAGILVEVFP